jgi:hypothetical protein
MADVGEDFEAIGRARFAGEEDVEGECGCDCDLLEFGHEDDFRCEPARIDGVVGGGGRNQTLPSVAFLSGLCLHRGRVCTAGCHSSCLYTLHLRIGRSTDALGSQAYRCGTS